MTSQRRFYPHSYPEFIRKRNRRYTKEGVSELDWMTRLSPEEEQRFRQWVGENNIPFDPNQQGPQDYDMRGFWRGLIQGNPAAKTIGVEGQLHFDDYWKTPLHETFSGYSQFATPDAPHWEGNRLIAPDGTVLFDQDQ